MAASTALLVIVGALVTPPPSADAASGISIEGRGFGHGIGMSQYGARDRAEAGHVAREILAAYYPGTTLATASDSDQIRVRIESDADNVTAVASESGLRLRTTLGTATLPASVGGSAPTQWRIRVASGALRLEALAGGTWRVPGSDVTALLSGRGYADFVASDGSVRLVLGSTYREYVGAVRAVRPDSSGTALRTVVVTTYAHYLPSVVAAEMPTSWHRQAVWAQAVAARTYAMFDAAARSTYFDTCDTTSCQVFNGRADYTSTGALVRIWADAAATSAVSSTAGRYVRYAGGPAFTQFSASNGGYSVVGSRPYLRPAADSFDRFPAWTTTLTASALRSAYPSIGSFTGFSVTRDGQGPYGGRVSTVRIVGTSGTVTVTGPQFRSAFGLRSTLFHGVLTGVSSPGRDVDRDGVPDLISVAPNNRVRVLYGVGGGRWGASQQVGSAWTGKTQVTTIHGLGGANTLEILAVEGAGNDLTAYPVSSQGVVGSRRLVHGGEWSRYDLFMGVGAFAGTGSVGVLARGHVTGTLYYFPSAANGRLGTRYTVASGWGAIRLATVAGDWNGDGRPDVIALDTSSRMWLYPSTGSRGFGTRVLLSASSGWSDRTSLLGGADWDGNGTLDLISVTNDGRLMLNERTGPASIGLGRRLDTGWTHRLL